jgi:hypothetical protein
MHAVGKIVWRLNREETAQLESLYKSDPVKRIMLLMQVAMGAAKRDPEVRHLLSQPGVVESLKHMALKRKESKSEQDELALEQDKPA